jgi:hypothetical protein
MVSELSEYEVTEDTFYLSQILGGADRQKSPAKKLNTDDCLKILVKYNNILNIKWTQH